MKYKIIITLLFITSIANAQLDKFQVKVEGLGCPFCAYGLEKKFKELKGIKDIKIQMKEGLMDFQYPSDKELKIEEVNTQVEKAGYTPISVTITRANGVEESSMSNSKKTTSEAKVLKQVTFHVAGNCDMCKARIESAALKIKGVKEALWNRETKEIVIKKDLKVSEKDLQKAIASAGHDTEQYRAKDSDYENLPPCCLYSRKSK